MNPDVDRANIWAIALERLPQIGSSRISAAEIYAVQEIRSHWPVYVAMSSSNWHLAKGRLSQGPNSLLPFLNGSVI